VSGSLGGSGKLVNDAGGVLSVAPGSTKFLVGTLENAGTLQIRDNLYHNSGGAGLLRNLGTVNFVSDANILEYNGLIDLENSGAVMKSGGSGSSNLNLGTLTNTGTLEAQSGILRVQNGTIVGGAYTAALNATLEFAGTLTFKGTFTGSPVGTVRLSASLNVPNAAVVHLRFAGTGLNFVSGSLIGPGKVINDAGYALNLTAGGSKFLTGTLENAGTVKIGDNLYHNSGGAGLIQNTGTLEFTADVSLLEYNGLINLENTGTVLKSGGAGSSNLYLGTLTNTTGLLRASLGTLHVQDGTVIGGSYDALSGATLEFAGAVTLRGTLVGAPQGTIRGVGLNLSVLGSEELHLRFAGTGFSFVSGSLIGPGKIVNDAGFTLNLTAGGSKFLVGTLENAGTLKVADNLYHNTGPSLLRNTGTLDFVADVGLLEYNGRIDVENTGSVVKSAGGGLSSFSLGTLSNGGTLESQIGTLRLQDGNLNGGSYTARAGATLEFAGGVTLRGTLSGAPVGAVQLSNVSLVVPTGETTHLNFSGTGLKFLSGNLAGPGTLKNDASATLGLAAGGTKFLTGTLENAGTLQMSDNLYHNAGGSGVLSNAGTLEFTNDSGILEYNGRVSLLNSGTLLKSGGAGNSTLTVIFSNSGTITQNSGQFVFTP
jgi:hypothetical protein